MTPGDLREMNRDGAVEQLREIHGFGEAAASCVRLLGGDDVADVTDVRRDGADLGLHRLVVGGEVRAELR